jgi:chloride channel protein, CIC family
LLVVATVSHLVSALVLKRSILTEKVARRGFHVLREYAVDPLEATFVREVMETDIYTADAGRFVADLYSAAPEGSVMRRQRLYPVLAADGGLAGVLPWSVVLATRSRQGLLVRDVMTAAAAVAHGDEVLRTVADRMTALGLGAMPVVSRVEPRRLEGIVTQFDLLQAREKLLTEERHAERVLRLPAQRPRTSARTLSAIAPAALMSSSETPNSFSVCARWPTTLSKWASLRSRRSAWASRRLRPL